MKDIFYKQLLLTLLIIISASSISAQEEVSRKIEKSYDFTNSGELQLENKYGNIIINGWDQNKIQITIDIKVNKKEKEEAIDLLSRIKSTITATSDFINIFYNIQEKDGGFFSRVLNKANPFDLDKGNIEVDYIINMPQNADARITNKFGDIIISDWNGKLKVNLQHGDMWINNDLANASIDLTFGKLRTKTINYAKIDLKNSEFEIEESKDIKITSNGSTININKASSLEIYSNKDKIDIEELERIQGELKFSNLILNQIKEDINLTMDVANLNVKKIINPDATIILKQKSSELNINISNLSFNFSASLEQGLLRIPKTFDNIETTMINSRDKLRNINATYGSIKKGKIQITGRKGVIILKEMN